MWVDWLRPRHVRGPRPSLPHLTAAAEPRAGIVDINSYPSFHFRLFFPSSISSFVSTLDRIHRRFWSLVMLVRWLRRQHVTGHESALRGIPLRTSREYHVSSRLCAQSAHDGSTSLSKTRNIGIIAHIDAVCARSFRFSVFFHSHHLGQDNHHGAYAVLRWLHKANRRCAMSDFIFQSQRCQCFGLAPTEDGTRVDQKG